MGNARRTELYIEYRKKVMTSVITEGTSSGSLYYSQYTGQSIHIDEIFADIGVESQYIGSWKNRKPVAEANGITSGYTGTYNQNVTLIGYAKAGTLKRVGSSEAVRQVQQTLSSAEATAFISPYAENVTYTDAADGQGDSLSITLDDRDGRFAGEWCPEQGTFFYARIDTKNWTGDGDNHTFECGEFLIDDITNSGPPSTCKIEGISVPQDQDFRSAGITRTWENATLRQIGESICNKYGLTLYMDAADVPIESIEQNGQTDCEFLYKLARSYGYSMKLYANKIVIYDTEAYEQKGAAATIAKTECESYDFKKSLYGTYTGATVAFTDPNTEQDYSLTIGEEGRMYEANITADSVTDLEKKGIAALNLQNQSAETATLKIFPIPGICAGQNVELTGFGANNGKYAINSVKHTISGNGSYNQSLSLRKIQAWIKSPSADAVEDAEEAAAETISYTVKSGDTLWSIAKQYLGAGKNYPQIYNDNKDMIESTAKSHGKTDSDNGHWIYPGEVLTINVTEEES